MLTSRIFRRYLGVVLLSVIVYGNSLAQGVRTVFAKQLHIVCEGNFSSGGVDWAKSDGGQAASWSANVATGKVEVAQDPQIPDDEQRKSRLLQILPGVSLSPVKVSTVGGWQGVLGNQGILGVEGKTAFWIVLVKAPNAEAFLNTVSLEREDAPFWMIRDMPCGLAALLPYEMAPDRIDSGRYEMKFEGFNLRLILQKPDSADAHFDIAKTVDDEVAHFKESKDFTDVTVNRMRIRELESGELVHIDYKEDGQAKSHLYVAGLHDGKAVQLFWDFDPKNDRHYDYSDRILLTLKPSKTNISGFQRFIVGNSGFSFETLGTPTVSKVISDGQAWSTDQGGIQVSCRIVESPSTDTEQVASEFAIAAKSESADAKTEVVPHVVNGVFSKLARSTWRKNEQSIFRHGLFIGTGTNLLVLIAQGSDETAVSHVINSAHLTLPRSEDKLLINGFKGSPLTVLSYPEAKLTSSGEDGDYSSVDTLQFVGSGEIVSSSVMQTLKEGKSVDLAKAMPNATAAIAKEAKAGYKVLNQGWGADGPGQGYWVAYDLDLTGAHIECYAYGYVLGRSFLLQSVVFLTTDEHVRALGQRVMNSYRLTVP